MDCSVFICLLKESKLGPGGPPGVGNPRTVMQQPRRSFAGSLSLTRDSPRRRPSLKGKVEKADFLIFWAQAIGTTWPFILGIEKDCGALEHRDPSWQTSCQCLN